MSNIQSLRRNYKHLIHVGGNMDMDPSGFLGSESSPATLSTSYDDGISNAIEISSNKYLILFVYCTELAGAARLDIQLEVSEAIDSLYWVPLQAESVSSGVAVQENYEIQKALSETGLVLAAAIPFRGFKYWRIKAKADTGAPKVYVNYSVAGGAL